MSQIFRVSKKVSKNQTNDGTNQAPNENDEVSAKSGCAAFVQNTKEFQRPYLIIDEVTDEEAVENARIVESIEDLRKYCVQIDDFIETSKSVLNRAYASDVQKVLQRRLKNSVAELMSIQNEMKTIMDNITTFKLQIDAVQSNIEDHRNKSNVLKTEERRTRFLLTHENKKNEKNAQNQERNLHKPRESRVPKYFITPTIGAQTRPIGGSSPHTTFVSRGASHENDKNDTSRRHPNSLGNAGSQIVRPSPNRPLLNTVKRVKAFRMKKEAPSIPTPQNDPPGVTVVLQPITETKKVENASTGRRRISTPSASIVNLPWFNNIQLDQTLSDTGTNSVVSTSNSLFVFSSSGHLDNLD